MNRHVIRAFVVAAVLAAGLSISAPVAQGDQLVPVAPGDPPGATCYHFPLITVCCDSGGCYILR
jgi:hypothetical protein